MLEAREYAIYPATLERDGNTASPSRDGNRVAIANASVHVKAKPAFPANSGDSQENV